MQRSARQAERLLGEMLAQTPKATGAEKGGRSAIDGSRREPSIQHATLEEIGIDKKTSMRSQQLAAAPVAVFEKASIHYDSGGLGLSPSGSCIDAFKTNSSTRSNPSGRLPVLNISAAISVRGAKFPRL